MVEDAIQEVRGLDLDVTALLKVLEGSLDPAANPAAACSLLINHLCMRRNKRCLLVFHRVRVTFLEELCWSGRENSRLLLEDTTLSSAGNEGMGLQSLNPEEEEYICHFQGLLAEQKSKWTDVDLTGNIEPPQDLFIDVRVLKDAGDIQTEYGYFL